jgi:phage terminase small subunit
MPPQIGLNKKQLAFIDEWFANGYNAKASYLKCYPNVTEQSAEVLGSKQLSNIKIKEEIERRQQELRKGNLFTRETILNEYYALLQSCKTEGIDGQGTIKDRTNWNKALAQLSKMLGYDAPDKVEIEHRGIVITYNKPND